jgi:membrane protease YdiL (CAAX protease family)
MVITSTTYFAGLFVLGGCLLLIRQNWFLWLPGSGQQRVGPLDTNSMDYTGLLWLTLAMYFSLPSVWSYVIPLFVPLKWSARVASMMTPLCLCLFLLCTFYRSIRQQDTLRSFPSGSLIPLGYLWFLLGFVIFIPCQLGWIYWLETFGIKSTPQATLVESSTTTDPVTLILIAFGAVILAPIWEELFFRGLVFRLFLRRMGFWSAAFFSALLFSIIHMQINGVAGFWVLGIVFALAYRITGTIWVPITIHAIHNLNALIISRYFSQPPPVPTPPPHDFISLFQ